MSITELKELVASIAVAQKETDRSLEKQFRETDRALEKQFRETDRVLEKQFRETDKEIRKLSRLFGSHWGRLVEALLGSGLPRLFNRRGIGVRRTTRKVEFFDDDGRCLLEIDVMIHNGGEDIAVEVKTTCRPDDIDEHLARLERLRTLDPAYASGEKRLYGAVASLVYEARSGRYAERKGLFVLKSTDGILSIENSQDFEPRAL